MRASLCVSACLLAACGGGAAPQPERGAAAPPSATTPEATPAPAAPASAVGGPRDAPEISRALGEPGGFVVFWPRVVPAASADALRPVAERVQQRLRAAVERAVPGATIDVRPAPERVCPRNGCQAMTVGAVVAASEKPGTCVVVAVVSGAGTAPQRLVPWAGEVVPKMAEVPFREPPESQITIKDWADCAGDAALAAGEEAVVQAIREVEAARVAR